jgi:beta-lactamase superfamily II metal-dependent hydrolase
MKPDDTRVPTPQRADRLVPSDLVDGTLNLIVFGPGKGEAILLVLPDGSVGVVDGCRESQDPARGFLEALKKVREAAGGALRIRFVCLTHPHDDHYAGLGRLIAVFRSCIEEVWTAMESGSRYAESLLKYTRATRKGGLPDIDDVKGLERILTAFSHAQEQGGAGFRYVLSEVRLVNETIAGNTLEIWGRGPFHGDVRRAHQSLIAAIDVVLNGQKQNVHFDPNIASGALTVHWGQAGVLLGGDLLCGTGSFKGWDGVHEHISPPIQVVKAAHHASLEAHHDALIRKLDAAVTLVTPFKNATASNPPRPEQIIRLAQGSVVAVTSEPDWVSKDNVPKQLYPARSPAPLNARNSALKLSRSAGMADVDNAVLVALDSTGKILKLVLAGKANIYD